ncbi:right-handed parallel beta-helix repeat-containing protein, partial [Planctomycetota bacterium]
ERWGGGIFNESSSPTVTNCIFSGNSANESGGGMYNTSFSNPTVTNCTFAGNSAGDKGGGMYNSHGSPTVTNCTFTGNSADSGSGGGMCNRNSSSPTVTNCTFSGNSAGNSNGGGMYNEYSNPTVTNCIFWGNEIYGVATVSYSCVEGGYTGTGNIDINPMFVDAEGADNTYGTDDDDLHLLPASLCINAGDPTGDYTGQVDMDGDPRVLLGRVDMGADESPTIGYGDIVYVDQSATSGSNNGRSWSDAFLTLQDALDVAAGGPDQIWVAAATYYPTTDYGLGIGDRGRHFRIINGVAIYGGFNGTEKALYQRDVQNNVTIISGDLGTPGHNGDNCYHVFYHPDGSALEPNAVLDGFTITGGNADTSNPFNCGGGMYNYNCSPTLIDCVFTNNRAYLGGGMVNIYGSPTITGCTFGGNSADYGGGIYNSYSSPTFTNCNFAVNSADDNGGGICNWNFSNPIVTNCTFTGNAAVENGGGICNDNSSSPTVTGCVFSGNSADLGGGMYNTLSSSPVVTNCTFGWNAAQNGSAVAFDSYNQSYPSAIQIINCILWNVGNEIWNNDGSTITITYSNVQGGWPGQGNIDAGPLFIDPNGVDNTPGTDDDNLRLSGDSPCIDTGDNNAVTVTSDLDQRQRVIDGDGNGTATVDMGAYEYGTVIIYVDADVAGGDNSGAGWENAYKILQDALDVAIYGDEIWVADGTYYPSMMVGVRDDRYMTFQLINGVAIYGGFTGTETALDQRDVQNNETILSGDIGVPGDNDDNCYHVFYHPGGLALESNAILDGVTVTAGYADGSGDYNDGGGMFNKYNRPTVIDCTFTGNTAKYFGGGVCNSYSSPTMIGCTFTDNSARQDGGGMYNYYSSPTITGCTFTGNSARYSGGGMFNRHSSPTITGCNFTSNSKGGICNYYSSLSINHCTFSGNSGRGMINYYASPIVTNCTFTGNSDGGMYNGSGSPTVTNCTFTGNSAGVGGGIRNEESNLKVSNCILWGNTAIAGGNEIYLNRSTIDIEYCDIKGGQDRIYMYNEQNCTINWGAGNINADPLFVDADGADDIFGTEDDNLRLSAGSPCIDAGCDAGVYDDIEGKVRPWDYPGVDNNGDEGEFDMGAYEFWLVEAALKVTPRTLNCRSKGKWMKAHLVLPEGFTIADIDTNIPATLQPMNLTSANLEVFTNKEKLVEIVASFDREAFCSASGDLSDGVAVFGYLTEGTVFYGTASVRIITPGLGELAELSAYWLRSGCEKPDWCGGLDLNRDSEVNMLDFALLGKSEIEFIYK